MATNCNSQNAYGQELILLQRLLKKSIPKTSGRRLSVLALVGLVSFIPYPLYADELSNTQSLVVASEGSILIVATIFVLSSLMLSIHSLTNQGK